MEQVLESPLFSGLEPLPARLSGPPRSLSYPKQALLRTTLNPQTPGMRASADSAPVRTPSWYFKTPN